MYRCINIKRIIMMMIAWMMICGTGVLAEDARLLCPENQLIIIRTEFLGETTSRYKVYDCYGDYLGTMENGNYILRNVDVVPDNSLNMVSADDGVDIYLLKEKKCLHMPVAYRSVDPFGNLIACSEDYGNSQMIIYNRDGEQVFQMPQKEVTSPDYYVIFSDIYYEQHGEMKNYYVAKNTDWEDFIEYYLVDEEGNIIEDYSDTPMASEAFWRTPAYKDGKWYILCGEDADIYDVFGNWIDECTREEYNSIFKGKESKQTNFYQSVDTTGTVPDTYTDAKVVGWYLDDYLVMEHGHYHGLIDWDGKWVLKQICMEE